eukprot:CAMPEP_0197444246 /NCGR_PEP_ID=MMETSP1175-20131217/9779_1 /TAXON_ID=1003142 /ORGANISM="Triceratium dubium, Strain CCMP147" /LENGTH=178 /DNA_ID=CAMNT_0042975005 /DNA_START=164 /DNA_END=700 /DNA_ORIENTATION=+
MEGVDFEDLCLDPYKESLERGRDEGREAGLRAGFTDGRSLGRTKGLEFGVELGYMRGVAVALLESSQFSDAETRGKSDKIQKTLRELVDAIDAFPSPDEMFSRTNGFEKLDVAGMLQRIRAKFKLLTVQLKLPQLSLTRVMNGALRASEVSSATEKAGGTGSLPKDEGTNRSQHGTEW